jgi:signal transduction histidine kinase
VLDLAGCIRTLNTPLATWLARDREEIVGRPLRTVLAECYPEWLEPLRGLEYSDEPFDQILLAAGVGGARQWFTCEISRSPDTVLVRLGSTLPPVAELAESPWDEHLASEGARREVFVRMLRAEARLHNLIAHWPGVIFSQRADFSFSFVSPKIEDLTGVSAAEWQHAPSRFWDVVHEGDAEELRQNARQSARTLRSAASTYRIRNLATRQIHYILEHRQAVATDSGLLLGYEGVWLDVTRQTLAEKRLSGAAWKETLSTLTMGMAHDFSNVLAGIHSLSESFCAQVEPAHPFHEGLNLIQKNARQASQLVHRIIHLHHGKTGERSYQDMNALITEVFELVRKVIPRTVEVSVALAPGQLPLYVDPVEFRQVAINLALNAAEAMPRGGQLAFGSSMENEPPPAPAWRGPRGPCVCFRVTDTGHGIDPRDLPTIFDPFFTTKAMNKGSGLGLYNAKLFVDKHGGTITVASAPGAGATFRLWLPLSDFTEANQPPSAPATPPRSLLLLGSSAKLVESSAEVLRLWGFSVSTALHGDEARHRLASAVQRPDGILALVEHHDPALQPLLDDLQRAAPASRMILQIAGCNQDQLATTLLVRADLIITADMSSDTILRHLRSLFT